MPRLWRVFKKEPIPKGQENGDGFWDRWQFKCHQTLSQPELVFSAVMIDVLDLL
jgi:hypothetical protein